MAAWSNCSWKCKERVLNRHMVVDVERPEDRRRYEVTVEQGEIVQGSIAYWDDDRREWDTPIELSEEQSFPFTVPGLFDMVRGELDGGSRTSVRVAMRGEPPFPQRIELGPVRMEGQVFEDAAGEVSVREFEPLPAD